MEFTEQDEADVTYAEKISSEDRRLDLTQPAADLAAKVRALTPHIGAYMELADGERLGVRAAHAVDPVKFEGVTAVSPTERPARGAVAVAAGGDALDVETGDGAIRLEIVQPPGGKAMPVADYLRGRPVPKFA